MLSSSDAETGDHLGYGSAVCLFMGSKDEAEEPDLWASDYFYMFITAAHVVDNEAGPLKRYDEVKFDVHVFEWDGRRKVGIKHVLSDDPDHELRTLVSEDEDLAVVLVRTDIDLELSTAEMLTEEEAGRISIGQRVYSASFAVIESLFVTQGVLSGINRHEHFVFDFAVGGGASGSCVYDQDAKLIGLVHGAYNNTMASAIPVDFIRTFLCSENIIDG